MSKHVKFRDTAQSSAVVFSVITACRYEVASHVVTLVCINEVFPRYESIGSHFLYYRGKMTNWDDIVVKIFSHQKLNHHHWILDIKKNKLSMCIISDSLEFWYFELSVILSRSKYESSDSYRLYFRFFITISTSFRFSTFEWSPRDRST